MVLPTENSRTILDPKKEYGDGEVKKLPQILAAFLATLPAFAFGMVLSWTSAGIPLLKEERFSIDLEEESWIGSLQPLGAVFGALPGGYFTNMLGPKRFLLILAVPCFASWMAIAFSTVIGGIYAGRFIIGLAIGSTCVAAPTYVAEIAHLSIRGTLGTYFQLQITAGILLQYILGAFLKDYAAICLISSAFYIIFVVTFFWMPESPNYLASKSDLDGARKSLSWFRGPNYDIEDELAKINMQLLENNGERAKISDFTSSKAAWLGLIIALGLMMFQQLSGVNAVLFYASAIFSAAGSSLQPEICSILIGVVQVLATLGSSVLIDRLGRKILLLTSAAAMAICLAALTAYYYLKDAQGDDLPSAVGVLPLVSLCGFIVVFSIGFGPIPWMIVNELFDSKLKGLVSSIAAAVNWVLAFTVTKEFQIFVAKIGSGATFLIFTVICALGAVFVGILVPETKGKDIHEVRELLEGVRKNKGVDNNSSSESSV